MNIGKLAAIAVGTYLGMSACSHAANSPWQFGTLKDELTDEVTLTIGSTGRGGVGVFFLCTPKALVFGVDTKKISFDLSQHQEIKYRVDEAEVLQGTWLAGNGTYFSSESEAKRVAQLIYAANDRFVFNDGSNTFTFNLVDAKAKLLELDKECSALNLE